MNQQQRQDPKNWLPVPVYYSRSNEKQHRNSNVKYGRFVPASNRNGLHNEDCCIFVLNPEDEFAEIQRRLVESLGDDLALQIKHVNNKLPDNSIMIWERY